ncbi:MAG: hypothetical protein IT441_00520 [Phycisphaeraceae bacterium]|nr:hypothetical protein [Phycisphaeraceae bacterium]
MVMPSTSALVAMILFGSVGMAAFYYGKKQAAWQPMVLGLALMCYPYFVSTTLLLYGIGTVLTAALFIFRG